MHTPNVRRPLAPVPCPSCGGVLTWTPDRWLAAHEQVFECRRCGELQSPDADIAPERRREIPHWTPPHRSTGAEKHSR